MEQEVGLISGLTIPWSACAATLLQSSPQQVVSRVGLRLTVAECPMEDLTWLLSACIRLPTQVYFIQKEISEPVDISLEVAKKEQSERWAGAGGQTYE